MTLNEAIKGAEVGGKAAGLAREAVFTIVDRPRLTISKEKTELNEAKVTYRHCHHHLVSPTYPYRHGIREPVARQPMVLASFKTSVVVAHI